MEKDDKPANYYDDKYSVPGWYWGKRPSPLCFKVLELLPPERPLTLLDIGCGEGRNAVFFARNGYRVSAFDLASAGVEKTKQMAEEAGVTVNAFQADINEFRLSEHFDILFSTGVLHYIPQERRIGIFDNYKAFTNENGLNAFTVFVKKPFLAPAPEKETHAHRWISGEVMTYYHDWKIEFSVEEIMDCMSSGVPHKHVPNRIIARKISGTI